MALFQVIKYNGPSHVLMWRHPKTDMTTGSQLIVGPTQTAVFVRGGVICDVLGPGSYTLNTSNLPILSALVNLPFGGKSPFTAEVFFINKLDVLDVKWGTARHIQLQDPVCHVVIPLRAFGQYGIRITDSRRFLECLAGTARDLVTQDLANYFRGILNSHIVEELSRYLLERKICFLEANAHLSEIGAGVSQALEPFWGEYGIQMVNFHISSINAPEGDPSVRKLRETLDRRHEMDILRYSYQQGRSFDILEEAAQTPGAGGAAVDIGVGAALGSALSGMVRDTLQPLPPVQNIRRCAGCGAALAADSAFCSKCGKPVERGTAYCTKCGAPMPAGSRFCGRCGQEAPLSEQF